MSEPEDTSIALFNQNEVNPPPLSEILEEDEQNPTITGIEYVYE